MVECHRQTGVGSERTSLVNLFYMTSEELADIELLGRKKDWSDACAVKCYDYMKSQDGGMSEAAMGNMADAIRDSSNRWLVEQLSKIKGGYRYMGACSDQLCFPLKSGGELRFSTVDEDCVELGESCFAIDLYDGALPPCITGPSKLTG